jgi:hypothetical protein
MVEKLILKALKEVLDPDKYAELIKQLGIGESHEVAQDATFSAGLNAVKYLGLGGVAYNNVYKATCYDSAGSLKWQDEVHNIVVDEGLVHTLSVVLDAGAQDTTWFLGLYGTTPNVLFGHTLATMPSEVNPYTGNRKPLTFGTASATAPGATLTATQVTYAITATQTVGGAFIAGVDTGTAGTLYGGAAFTGGDKSVDNGDTLNVDVTINASSS